MTIQQTLFAAFLLSLTCGCSTTPAAPYLLSPHDAMVSLDEWEDAELARNVGRDHLGGLSGLRFVRAQMSGTRQQHPVDVAILVVEGEGTLRISSTLCPVRSEQVIVIPAGTPYETAGGNIEALTIARGPVHVRSVDNQLALARSAR